MLLETSEFTAYTVMENVFTVMVKAVTVMVMVITCYCYLGEVRNKNIYIKLVLIFVTFSLFWPKPNVV